MIFWGGMGAALVVERQWLVADKITKKWKNAKKSVRYLAGYPCFSAKQPYF
jgi:hypothetical protein